GIETEDVDVDCGAARHAGPGLGDRAHHDGGVGDAEAGAAVILGNADAEPAALGEGLMKIDGKAARLVPFQPIGVVERATQLADRGLQLFLFRRQGKIHHCPPRIGLGSTSSADASAAAHCRTTPDARSAAISAGVKPASLNTSTLCSPRRGAWRVGSGCVRLQVLATRIDLMRPSL